MITTSTVAMNFFPFPAPRAVARIIGLLTISLAALALQGCSAVKLVYNTAPEIAYWWVDDYVDLNDAQAARTREGLAALQAWHRSNELPGYADILARAARMAAADVTPEQVCAMVQEGRAHAMALAARAEPAAAALALTLTQEQLANIEKRYAKNNRKYRAEWVDVSQDEQRQRRYKQVLDRSEMIYGRLDDAQRQVIRLQIEASSFDAEKSYAERLRRQRDALQILNQVVSGKPPPAHVRAQLRAYIERGFESPDPTYRAYQQTLMRESCRGFALAHNTATPAQRDTAARRLKAYEKSVRELAAAQ
jgi:hypothetical protein